MNRNFYIIGWTIYEIITIPLVVLGYISGFVLAPIIFGINKSIEKVDER